MDNTLEVTITLQDAIIKKYIFNNTKDIIITFDSLIKNLIDEIAKLQDFSTIDLANKQDNDLSSVLINEDITTKFNTITKNAEHQGVTAPLTSNFRQGISIVSVVVKETYNSFTKTLKVTITLRDANNKNVVNNTKDIIVTFERVNQSLEIAKLQDFTTIDSVNKQDNNLSLASKGDDITIKFNAITEWRTLGASAPLTNNFKQGVSIASVVVKEGYNSATKILKVIITLKYELPSININPSYINNTKDITITFEYWTLKEEIDKLQNFKTSDLINKQDNDLSQSIVGTNIKTKFEVITGWKKIGINSSLTSSLSPGISIKSVVVKEKYNPTTKKLKVTIVLEDDNNLNVSNNTKDIIITFGLFDLENEITKFLDDIHSGFTIKEFDNFNNKGSDLSSAIVGDDITVQFSELIKWGNLSKSHLKSALSNNIIISSVVIKEKSIPDNTFKVTITLRKNNNSNVFNNKKDIIVTFS